MKIFDKTGSVEDLKKSAEDGGYVSQNCKEAIHEIVKDSGVSIRGVKKTSAERIVDVSIGTIHSTVRKDLKLKPYVLQLRHGLKQNDLQRRVTFCRWFLRQCSGGIFHKALFSSR